MAKFHFNIGVKLGLTAGVGVMLVAGMLTNELFGNRSIAALSQMVTINYDNKGNAQAAQTPLELTRMAIRDISSARTAEQLDGGLRAFRQSAAEAGVQVAAAEQRASRQIVKELYRETKSAIDRYSSAAAEQATAQKRGIESLAKRNQTAATWQQTLDAVLASPALAGLSGRRDIELHLRAASASFNAAHVAGWRFAATSDAQQTSLMAHENDTMIEFLKRSRAFAGGSEAVAGIDRLFAAAADFKAAAEEVVTAGGLKAVVRRDQVLPIAIDIDARIGKAVGIGTEYAAIRHHELLAELNRVGTVALAVGVLVILILVGSAVFTV